MAILFIRDILEINARTGLDMDTITNLLREGWTFETKTGEADRWVSPASNRPIHIPHREPVCNTCPLIHPHHHGLTCSTACTECHGICHPDCPAYKKET